MSSPILEETQTGIFSATAPSHTFYFFSRTLPPPEDLKWNNPKYTLILAPAYIETWLIMLTTIFLGEKTHTNVIAIKSKFSAIEIEFGKFNFLPTIISVIKVSPIFRHWSVLENITQDFFVQGAWENVLYWKHLTNSNCEALQKHINIDMVNSKSIVLCT